MGGRLRALFDACVVGYGRIGRVTARLLSGRGLRVRVYEASRRRVVEARGDGFDAVLSDVSSERAAREAAESCRVVATALPGLVAVEVVRSLVEAGAGAVVDVSYVPDPWVFRGVAERHGARVVVDAGLAPGLSSVLVAASAGRLREPRDAYIYVGGIAAEQRDPLGLVASWNVEDLLEEYTRPARARLGGSPVELDPVADATRVEVPGAGVFDALPTDGLRTLLDTLRGPRNMVEYTLRYPGHAELLRTLRQLGLLSERSYVAEGCALSPRSLLARLLEERLPRTGDRVVLYTVARGLDEAGEEASIEYFFDVTQADLGLEDTAALSYLTGAVHAWYTLQALRGWGRPGVNPPEEAAPMLHELLGYLRGLGLHVSRRICRTS